MKKKKEKKEKKMKKKKKKKKKKKNQSPVNLELGVEVLQALERPAHDADHLFFFKLHM